MSTSYRWKFAGCPTRSKFKNVRSVVDGIQFDSLAEVRRYRELLLEAKAGVVQGLVFHEKFPLEVLGKRICVYETDFTYNRWDEVEKEWVKTVEDVKGVRTPVYNLKKKLFEVLYPEIFFFENSVRRKAKNPRKGKRRYARKRL